MLLVDEIFPSIQGESTNTGRPCVFVRLYGCNLSCGYCDQPQSKDNCHKMNIDKILKEVRSHKVKYVCITGGEPLIQQDTMPLVYELQSLGFEVSIETNGSIAIDDDDVYNRSFSYVMDIKTPSSGMSEHNLYSNLKVLHSNDEVKFVVTDRNDYEFAKRTLMKYNTRANILFSPLFYTKEVGLGRKVNKQSVGKDLVSWLLEDSNIPQLQRARVQLQLHKILGVQ